MYFGSLFLYFVPHGFLGDYFRVNCQLPDSALKKRQKVFWTDDPLDFLSLIVSFFGLHHLVMLLMWVLKLALIHAPDTD